MNGRVISYAGIVTMVCFAIFTVMTNIWSNVALQPTFTPLPEAEFLRASYEAATAQLAWFGLDAILIIGYITVFVGLYAAADPKYAVFAKLGLAFIIAAGTFDFVENSYLNSITLAAQNGVDLAGQPVLLLSAIGYLKTIASVGALAFLGIALPKKTTLQRTLGALMLVAAVGTIIGTALPEIAIYVNFPRIAVMVLVIIYFWNMRSISATHS